MAQPPIEAFQLQTNVANGILQLNSSGEVTTSFLETNVANGVVQLDGSTKIATSLLETDVANGVPSLDGSGNLSFNSSDISVTDSTISVIGTGGAPAEVTLSAANFGAVTFIDGDAPSGEQQVRIASDGGSDILFQPLDDSGLPSGTGIAFRRTGSAYTEIARENNTVWDAGNTPKDAANGIPTLDANGDLNLQGFDVTYEEYTGALGGDFDGAAGGIQIIRVGNVVTVNLAGVSATSTLDTWTSSTAAVPSRFRPSRNYSTLAVATSSWVAELTINSAGSVVITFRNWSGTLTAVDNTLSITASYNINL